MTQEDLYALLPFVLLALVFWFLVFRPARKRQRETQQTQASLEVGVRVMLTSGIFGDVVSVGDDTIEVEIASGTVVTAHRQAVGRTIPAATEDDDTDNDEPADDVADESRDDDGDTSADDDSDGDTSADDRDEAELHTRQEK